MDSGSKRLSEFDLLLRVCKRPGLFLGRETYSSFFDFLRGYSYACQEQGVGNPFDILADLIFGMYFAYHPAISPEDILVHYFKDGDFSSIENLIVEGEALINGSGFNSAADWRSWRIRSRYGSDFGAPEILLAEALRRKSA